MGYIYTTRLLSKGTKLAHCKLCTVFIQLITSFCSFFSIILIHFTRLQDDLKVISLNLLRALIEIKGLHYYKDFKDRDIFGLLENG